MWRRQPPPANATNKAKISEWFAERVVASHQGTSDTCSQRSQNVHPKIMLFSLGLHYAARIVAESNRSDLANSRGMGPAQLRELEERTIDSMAAPIWAFLQYLAARRAVHLVIFQSSQLDCRAMLDPRVKRKNTWIWKHAPQCATISWVIDLIVVLIRGYIAAALLEEGRSTGSDFATSFRDLVDSFGSQPEPSESFMATVMERAKSAFASLSAEDQHRMRLLALKFVALRGFRCNEDNDTCYLPSCYCTLEGIHLKRSYLYAQANNVVGLVLKLDRCLRGVVPSYPPVQYG